MRTAKYVSAYIIALQIVARAIATNDNFDVVLGLDNILNGRHADVLQNATLENVARVFHDGPGDYLTYADDVAYQLHTDRHDKLTDVVYRLAHA